MSAVHTTTRHTGRELCWTAHVWTTTFQVILLWVFAWFHSHCNNCADRHSWNKLITFCFYSLILFQQPTIEEEVKVEFWLIDLGCPHFTDCSQISNNREAETELLRYWTKKHIHYWHQSEAELFCYLEG